ncbi:MAG: hypothetical protein A2Z97_08610 [Bdellovibrionales bacterium GWB1_52_6]|nr:MAG: hypothetical protein A2Z97_08610 [Bdellovibrionales bacterium GWB1_52_6]
MLILRPEQIITMLPFLPEAMWVLAQLSQMQLYMLPVPQPFLEQVKAELPLILPLKVLQRQVQILPEQI